VRPWYETAFGRDYLERYPHRDDAEAQADVAAIVELIEPDPRLPLLDLGCGAGRHLLAFCEAGFRDLVGLDLSRELLNIARERIAEAGCSVRDLHCCDMRTIPYEAHFATAVSIFTSFGYFETDDEDAKVLSAVHRALRPGGRFLVDTLHRESTIARIVPEEDVELPGGRGHITRTVSEDGKRVEKIVRFEPEDGAAEAVRRESVRMYAPEEITEMFEAAGFVDVRVYGSLRGEPIGPDAPRLVLVGRKDAP